MQNSFDKKTYFVEVTESELAELQRSRRLAQAVAEQRKEQAECTHQWRYDGHSHHDDCYVCTKCGVSEYR